MVDQLVCDTSVPKGDGTILGISFSSLSLDALVWRVLFDRVPKGEGARLVVTANVDHISNLVRNARFRDAYANAWVATADGMPVYLYARLRGGPARELVTGSDLSAALMQQMEPQSCRPFFVTSSPEASARLIELFTGRGFDAGAIGTFCPPFGFENDPAASEKLARAIRDHGTTHLFFGLGAPKSEIWINEHRRQLGDLYALAVGASLDFHVGLRRRAPVWMRRSGLEWAWRVMNEPKRLFRRYFIDSWYALWAVALDVFAIKTPDSAAKNAPQKTREPA
jgi:bacterial polymer biosynthesis proteins, WecB/TagA/CpsF family